MKPLEDFKQGREIGTRCNMEKVNYSNRNGLEDDERGMGRPF